jgi:hypothetical protein
MEGTRVCETIISRIEWREDHNTLRNLNAFVGHNFTHRKPQFGCAERHIASSWQLIVPFFNTRHSLISVESHESLHNPHPMHTSRSISGLNLFILLLALAMFV